MIEILLGFLKERRPFLMMLALLPAFALKPIADETLFGILRDRVWAR